MRFLVFDFARYSNALLPHDPRLEIPQRSLDLPHKPRQHSLHLPHKPSVQIRLCPLDLPHKPRPQIPHTTPRSRVRQNCQTIPPSRSSLPFSEA
eukprot:1584006-Rhodomonas_salina.1